MNSALGSRPRSRCFAPRDLPGHSAFHLVRCPRSSCLLRAAPRGPYLMELGLEPRYHTATVRCCRAHCAVPRACVPRSDTDRSRDRLQHDRAIRTRQHASGGCRTVHLGDAVRSFPGRCAVVSDSFEQWVTKRMIEKVTARMHSHPRNSQVGNDRHAYSGEGLDPPSVEAILKAAHIKRIIRAQR